MGQNAEQYAPYKGLNHHLFLTNLRALCVHVSSAKRIAGSNEKISNNFSLCKPVSALLLPSVISPGRHPIKTFTFPLNPTAQTRTHPSLTPSIYLSAAHLSSDSRASLRHDRAIVHGSMGWVRAHRILLPCSDVSLCGKVRRQVNKTRRVEHRSVVSTCAQPRTQTLL